MQSKLATLGFCNNPFYLKMSHEVYLAHAWAVAAAPGALKRSQLLEMGMLLPHWFLQS